jgi:hypothetical protein
MKLSISASTSNSNNTATSPNYDTQVETEFSFKIQAKLQELVTFQVFKLTKLRTLLSWDTAHHHWVFTAQCFKTVVASSSLDHQPLQMRPTHRLEM